MSINDLLIFGALALGVILLMLRWFVRMEEGPPVDTDLLLRLASAFLLAFAVLMFTVSAALFSTILMAK